MEPERELERFTNQLSRLFSSAKNYDPVRTSKLSPDERPSYTVEYSNSDQLRIALSMTPGHVNASYVFVFAS